MNPWLRRLVILVLLGALILVLLRFQGIILRPEHETVSVPLPPALEADAHTATVELRGVWAVETFSGFVEAIDPASVAPRVMAPVLSVTVREGQSVHRGDVLISLDDRDAQARLAQAQSALAAAEAAALQARLAFERAERLLQAEAMSQAQWEAARAANAGAQAEVERLQRAVDEARTAQSWYELRAPFDGRVLERKADPGDLALPGRPLLTLYRREALRLGVAVPEERVAGLSVGAEFALRFDDRGERLGTLERILPAADASSGTVTLHLRLADPSALSPGTLGRVDLPVGEREVLLIPSAAVQRVGQIERVQRVIDGRVVPVTIRTGKLHGEDVEVLSGLAPEDVVVLP